MIILKIWVIKTMVEKTRLKKLQVQERFLAFIIVDAIVIVFNKATHNSWIDI